MTSRISIEVDFDNNNEPVLQILQRKSDDVRDSLLSAFLQKFNGNNRCSIEWKHQDNAPDGASRIFIRPIKSGKEISIPTDFSLYQKVWYGTPKSLQEHDKNYVSQKAVIVGIKICDRRTPDSESYPSIWETVYDIIPQTSDEVHKDVTADYLSAMTSE